MAQILEHYAVADGYEAVVVLKDGRRRRWHWLSKPADLADAVDEAEVRLKMGEIEEWKRGDEN